MRRHLADQGGQTLLEVLLVMVIASILVIPTLAWMVTGIRVGTRVEEVSSTVRSQNLLTSYLQRDVASALDVSTVGADCAGGVSVGGTVVLALTQSGSVRAVYSVATVDGATSVWRRRCSTAGVLRSELDVVGGAVQPAAGWASIVSCPGPGTAGPVCGRRVEVSIPVKGDDVVTVGAIRRIGADS